MKTNPIITKLVTILSLFALATILFGAFKSKGQDISLTNGISAISSNPTIQGGLQQIVDAAMTATNYGVAPYFTYAPSLKSGDKYGAGLLGVYNVNNYAGIGLGVDYLGQFSLISANVTFKLPVKPFQSWTTSPQWLRDVEVVPLGLLGTGKPMSNGGSGAATIWDTGGMIHFGHWLGGQFSVGATYGAWDNAGDYSGHRYHAFVGWSKGF